MAAGKYNILIQQGTNFGLDLTVQNAQGAALNLDDLEIVSQARIKITDAHPVITFTVTKTDAQLGKFRLSLTAEQTAALNFDRAMFDVVLKTEAGSADRLIQGNVVLSKTVTR